MEYISEYVSPAGKIILSSDGKNLTGLWFENQKYFKDTLDKEYEEKSLPVFENVCAWLDRYFKGENPDVTFHLKPKGSDFRQRVWRELLNIPYGKTITYGEIAKKLEKDTGKKASAQAVGGAVGHNPISIIIPCHRVVGSDGSLTGYAGGLEKKKYLLDLEKDII